MYSHTQFGWMTTIALVGAMAAFNAAWDKLGPASPGKGTLEFVMTLLGLMLLLFGWLTVKVDNEAVTARFGIGLICKKIRISDIQSAIQVRNKWYYGWGMRMGPWGWMYNVSGLDAVEITMKNGGKFRVGTDEAEALARAIKQKIVL